MSTSNPVDFFNPNTTEQFVDPYTGYTCYLRLVTVGDRSHWCGYVSIPKGHPMYGQPSTSALFDSLKVHGGITFAEFVEDGQYMVGFDCAHAADDFDPKSWQYARMEAGKLCQQLKNHHGNTTKDITSSTDFRDGFMSAWCEALLAVSFQTLRITSEPTKYSNEYLKGFIAFGDLIRDMNEDDKKQL